MSRGKFISTISTVAILLAPLSLHAASGDRQYRESLLHIKGLAEAAAVQAHQLELYGTNSMTSSDVPQSALYELKSEVNAMGKQLEGLEANRGSLTRWEQNAVDSVLPLVEDAARKRLRAARAAAASFTGPFLSPGSLTADERVRLIDGSVCLANRLHLDADQLHVQRATGELRLPVETVVSVVNDGGKVHFLAGLKPRENPAPLDDGASAFDLDDGGPLDGRAVAGE